MPAQIVHGECVAVMDAMEPDSFDAFVTDPPYHLTAGKKGGSGPASVNLRSPAGRARISTGFMGKHWDGGDVAFRPKTWAAALRVLKPGAYLLAFGGTRTYHRLACAIEDAGFEIRDTIMWLYGSGFPKSLDVSKAMDRAAGAEREPIGQYIAPDGKPRGVNLGIQGGKFAAGHSNYVAEKIITAPATEAARQWQGWGTALKPACEPIVVARKPLAYVTSAEIHGLTGWDHWHSAKSDGEDKIVTGRALHGGARSFRARLDKNGREVAREDLGAYEPFSLDAVAANVLRWGTGAINVEASRVPVADDAYARNCSGDRGHADNRKRDMDFAMGCGTASDNGRWPANVVHDGSPEVEAAFARFGTTVSVGMAADESKAPVGFGDTGTAARFFYCAKASREERCGSKHPTIKPIALMEWLVRLVTPPGGRVLDCFAGTGTTGVACERLGFDCVLIEQDAATVAEAAEKIARFGQLPVQPQLGL